MVTCEQAGKRAKGKPVSNWILTSCHHSTAQCHLRTKQRWEHDQGDENIKDQWLALFSSLPCRNCILCCRNCFVWSSGFASACCVGGCSLAKHNKAAMTCSCVCSCSFFSSCSSISGMPSSHTVSGTTKTTTQECSHTASGATETTQEGPAHTMSGTTKTTQECLHTASGTIETTATTQECPANTLFGTTETTTQECTANTLFGTTETTQECPAHTLHLVHQKQPTGGGAAQNCFRPTGKDKNKSLKWMILLWKTPFISYRI